MEAGRLQKQEGLNSDVLARSLFILLLSFIAFRSAAQDTSLVYGRLINQDGVPIEAAHIHLQGTDHVTTSDENGRYNIWVPSNQPATIIFSHLSFGMYTEQVTVPRGEKRRLDKTLQASATLLNPVDIEKVKKRQGHMLSSIDPKPAATLPGPNPGIEGLLKVVGIGVSSNNELSSQYSVRGGNFDENLVYVNDIEIYRPFLVRSGQQEGLSFVNPDMVSSVEFSAGGFEARYGDKMSSVLDIHYKDPLKFGGSVSGSLLGGSLHLEDASENHRFTYVAGLRYKTNQYVLKSLDTDGEYKPYFTDFQSLFTYDLSPAVELEALTSWSRNHYTVVPQSRTTEFGTVKQALQLRVFFEGQEVDEFDTYFGALAVNIKPDKKTKLRFIGSAFQTFESETFDILGQYYLGELETDYGKDNFGDVAFNRGVGSFLNHARNYLDATVITGEHKGEYKDENARYYWGFKAGKELIHDQLSEWTLIDSAGYSLPHTSGNTLDLFEVSKANLGLSSHRFAGYAQGTWTLNDSIDMELSAGVRTQYWDVNEQWLFSPRASLSFEPNWKKETVIRFASGVYHQPPFYRELRNTEGQLN
ncbi:MAG: carboxypeptidase-like regulatory domain-containing protein, partial [Flavobacteriales bacterium]|nr:carboxypeptidase-like regulatory domain-containing protein [Flavobacteriales bacterium]